MRAWLQVTPAFAQQPRETVCAEYGANAVFTAQAANPQPDYFLWYENGAALADGGRLSGTTTDTLTLSDVRLVLIDPFCSNYSENSALQALPVGECPDCPTVGDMDNDGDYDLFDLYGFTGCFGTDVSVNATCACANLAANNTVIDLADWDALTMLLTGPN
jgi:hypothetical protein